jgi:hypothetical protein
MSHRISRAMLWLVPILVVTLFPIRASGQESAAKEAREEKAEHSPQSVTGCLQKGDEPGGFVLTGDDGKTWELKSVGGVKLDEHVGHKVTVTGSRSHESKKEEEKMEKAEKKEAGGKEYNDLKVDKLEMVSGSCK